VRKIPITQPQNQNSLCNFCNCIQNDSSLDSKHRKEFEVTDGRTDRQHIHLLLGVAKPTIAKFLNWCSIGSGDDYSWQPPLLELLQTTVAPNKQASLILFDTSCCKIAGMAWD